MRGLTFSITCLCGLLGLLPGCSLQPRYERPALPVAQAFPGADESSSPAPAADLGWSEFFADPRLKALLVLALLNNRDLRVASLNAEQTRAQYRVTRAASYPTVEGVASSSRTHQIGVTSDIGSVSVGFTAYELDLWGRVRSLNHQALEEYFAQDEARKSAQISLIATLATEYFTLREIESQWALAQETLSAVEESLAINEALFQAGASTELDVRTAQGQRQTARINVLSYERQRAQAINSLVLLLGQPLPQDLPAGLQFDDPQQLAGIGAGLPSDLLLRRPDILEAEHTLKAANAYIGAARAAFFPTLSLTGSLGVSSPEFSRLFNSGTGTWEFAPQISVPIFAGGANRANLDAARIRARIEVANYEKTIQTAFREVADALVSIGNYQQQITEENALIEFQRARYDLATLRFRQGVDSYLNVLSAQQDLYSAQQARLLAQFQLLASKVSLYEALGGGWK